MKLSGKKRKGKVRLTAGSKGRKAKGHRGKKPVTSKTAAKELIRRQELARWLWLELNEIIAELNDLTYGKGNWRIDRWRHSR